MEREGGTNTILIVIILVILVAGFMWFFLGRGAGPAEDSNDFGVEVNLPEGNGGGNGGGGEGGQ